MVGMKPFRMAHLKPSRIVLVETGRRPWSADEDVTVSGAQPGSQLKPVRRRKLIHESDLADIIEHDSPSGSGPPPLIRGLLILNAKFRVGVKDVRR